MHFKDFLACHNHILAETLRLVKIIFAIWG